MGDSTIADITGDQQQPSVEPITTAGGQQAWWYPFPDLAPRLENFDTEMARLTEAIYRAKRETVHTTDAVLVDTHAALIKLETAQRQLMNLREITADLTPDQAADVLRHIREEAIR